MGKNMASYWRVAHYYGLLKTKPSARPDELRENFLKLSKIYHPDNAATGDQGKFIRLKEAYDKVKDCPLQRDEPNASRGDLTHAALIRRTKQNKWNSPGAGHYTQVSEKLYR